jgi:hypothetical protein
LNIDIDHIGERPMTRFQISQIASVAMSAAFVLASWLATVTVPASPVAFAAAPVAVELA